MKAVVLSGGGSKGSYQMGVWKALRKLHYNYEIVTGTSAGALNGALMTQNSYFKGLRLWQKINLKVLFGEDTLELSNNLDLYKMYGKNFFKNGGMDVKDIENIISRSININKFYNSKINFGLVTFNLSKKKAVELEKSEIDKEHLTDYLMASATCYPAFKLKDIKGLKYIDGGFYDNLPINLAVKMGATEIIAVDLRAPGIKKQSKNKNIPITTIKPNNKLTNFLNFNEEGAKQNIKFGYNDTMKVFNKYEGQKFTFKKGHLDKNKNIYGETFIHIIKQILNSNHILNEYRRVINMTNVNSEDLKGNFFNLIMESTGRSFGLDETKIYSYKKFNNLLKKQLKLRLKITSTKSSLFKKDEIDLYLLLQKHKFKELRKLALINPLELLHAIYLFSLVEA